MNWTLSVRTDKIISWQVNEGRVFADRCLLFSAESVIQHWNRYLNRWKVDYIQIEAETVLGLGDQGCRPGLLTEEVPEENVVLGEKCSIYSSLQ
jgi:hypothetical protein